MAGLIWLGSFALYARTVGFPFIFFDDNQYVTANIEVRAGLGWAGVQWAFTTFHAANWHPLTWLSHMLDVQLFGLDAGKHHLVNAGLHACNAALFFVALARMTAALGKSALVGLLFAVHPLHVESVAWVAERKDVLSTFFGLLALWAWDSYARHPRVGRYLLVALLFSLSLMAKPMWVTFPFLLLLLDFWPRARFQVFPAGRLVLEKVPLLLLSAASSIVTVVAQTQGGAVAGVEHGLGVRLANALIAYVTYLLKICCPVRLAVFYPHPQNTLMLSQAAGALLLLLLVTAAALSNLKRAPWLAVGWCWFLGTLVPVIGLVQVGGQAMADRYTYLPAVGIFVAIAWLGDDLATHFGANRLAAGVGGGCVIALAPVAWVQIGHWADHEVLLKHSIAVTPPNGEAQAVLAQGLRATGRLEEALRHALEATRLEPTASVYWHNLGALYRDLRRLSESRDAFRRAVQLAPSYALAWASLGQAELDLNDASAAVAAFRQAIRFMPPGAQASYTTGQLNLASGQLEEARRSFQEAARLKPNHVLAWTQLGILEERAGRVPEAERAFRAAVWADREDPTAWRNLGIFFSKYGQPAEGAKAFEEVARIQAGR